MPKAPRICASLLAATLAAFTCGCAGIRVELAEQGIDFGTPLSSAADPVGVVLFADETSEPGELGSMTSFLPPPVNTYRTAWVWGTLKFYCDEPLSREFTNAVAEGLSRVGCRVFRSPAPPDWGQAGIRGLAARTGAPRIVHGTVHNFRIQSEWTLTDPCDMSIVFGVRVFDQDGNTLYDQIVEHDSTRYLVAGELGAATAQKQAAHTFQRSIEKLFRDTHFRKALEATE